jgi:excisionase family DNA binding protein
MPLNSSKVPRLDERAEVKHPLMTVTQAATMLGFSDMTIRRRIEARQFPAVKIGRKALVPRAFVEELLKAASSGQTVVVEEFARVWSAASGGGAV